MDLTKEYVEQCKGASKIQKLWSRQDGDYYYSGVVSVTIESDHDYTRSLPTGIFVFPKPVIYGNTEYYLHQLVDVDKLVWLPKQDQLQSLLDAYESNSEIAKVFGEWAYDMPLGVGASFEQLWLAFVMLKKFKKKWNGKTWVELSEAKL